MNNLKQLTDNLSINPYTRRSLSMKDNSELYTDNKSIIRAINEIYLNQKSIFNSLLLLYKKLNITVGDIVENKDLKTEYNALQFASIIDGIVKISKRVDDISAVSMHNAIVELSDMVKGVDTDVNHVFTTMNWDNIIDALIKIDKKLADYMIEDTQTAADEYTQIRDDINDLVTIIGSSDENDRNNLVSKFDTIIKAVLALDNFIGVSELNIEQLNKDGYESLSHAVLDFSEKISAVTANIDDLNLSQTVNNTNFTNINNAIDELTRDLQGLAAGMGQVTGADLTDLGYDSIADGLRKLAAADRKMLEIVGDIDSDATYAVTYQTLGHPNLMSAIISLTNAISAVSSSDPAELEEMNAAGYTSMVGAINGILKLLGVPSLNADTLEAMDYTSIINAIVKITDTLSILYNQVNSSVGDIAMHNEDTEAHPNCISGHFRHKTEHKYNVGEFVFIPELPNNLCLVCIKEGTTSNIRPSFEGL